MKLSVVTVAAGSVAILAGALAAQTAAASRTFEVATIRQAAMPTPETFRGGQFRAGTTISEGAANFEFVTLADLIPYAYGVKTFQVSGPASLRESRWNIRAKLPAGTSQNDVPEMVRALLVDRFKLVVHQEKRDQPVYELTVAKGGPKLTLVDKDDTGSAGPASGLANSGLPNFFPPFGGPGGRGGNDGRGGGDGRGQGGRNGDGRGGPGIVLGDGNVSITANDSECGMHLEFAKLTMAGLADTLTPFVDRPVVDGTGLKGSYKASLKLPMEVMFAMMQNQIRNANLPPPGGGGPGGPGGRGPGDGPGGGPGGRGPGACDPGQAFGANSDNSNAALFQAVQQLGLKLQARKAPFDTIVVDHVEREPSDN